MTKHIFLRYTAFKEKKKNFAISLVKEYEMLIVDSHLQELEYTPFHISCEKGGGV